MAEVDPNAPLIAGAALQTWRDGCPGPVAMLAEVTNRALADAGGSTGSANRLGALCVIRYVSASHTDPAALVAAELGIEPGLRIHTSIGGDTPQAALGELAGRIAAGRLESAVICGGEALSTVARHLREGTKPPWDQAGDGGSPDELLGVEREANSPVETAAGLIAPLMIYPLFEHALWNREGGTVEELRERLGRLQERFSTVAAGNRHAWSPGPFDAGFIARPSPDNRLVTLPYTKLMNSNIQTDQAAALFVCSHSKADSLGIPLDRRVYLHGSAKATEPWFFSTRDDLGRSPALRGATSAALQQAGCGVDDVAHFDLYSCFPSAVRIAGLELGIDPTSDPRPPTVTGGLAFAGGPGNAYVLQSLAAMTERLRDDPEDRGLVTAVGWYLTKHAAGVFGASPPDRRFTEQAVIDEPPAARAVAPSDWSGEATSETATVIHERDGSRSFGIVTALLDDGTRVLRSSVDPEVLDAIPEAPIAGTRIRTGGVGDFSFA